MSMLNKNSTVASSPAIRGDDNPSKHPDFQSLVSNFPPRVYRVPKCPNTCGPLEPGELADMPILWHAVLSVPDKIIKKTLLWRPGRSAAIPSSGDDVVVGVAFPGWRSSNTVTRAKPHSRFRRLDLCAPTGYVEDV